MHSVTVPILSRLLFYFLRELDHPVWYDVLQQLDWLGQYHALVLVRHNSWLKMCQVNYRILYADSLMAFCLGYVPCVFMFFMFGVPMAFCWQLWAHVSISQELLTWYATTGPRPCYCSITVVSKLSNSLLACTFVLWFLNWHWCRLLVLVGSQSVQHDVRKL